VTISPDLGERYLNTVYQPDWLKDVYGEDVLGSDDLDVNSLLLEQQPHQLPTVSVTR